MNEKRISEVDIIHYDPKSFDSNTYNKNIKIIKKHRLTGDSVFIDVGAHRGEEINFLQNIGCKIHSFECNPHHYVNLEKLYGSNSNIVLNELLVTDVDDELRKCYFKESTIGGSMSEESSKTNISKTRHVYVKTRKLSTYIKEHNLEKIDVVKIDAEGSEFKIIEDLIETKMINRIKSVLYEDHVRKIKSSEWKHHRKSVLEKMKNIAGTKFSTWY